MSPVPAIVLCYHRVRPEEDLLHLSVHPDRFAQHLERLGAVADVVPLAEVATPSSRPRVAITFDDGYADNAETAASMLVDAGMPATFFITSSAIDGDGDFWWEQLDHVVLEAQTPVESLRVRLAARQVTIDVRSELGRRRAHALLNRHLLRCTQSEQQSLLGEVADQLGWRSTGCASHRKITDEQVQELARHELFDIGGHTASHPVLASLDRDGQEREITANRARLGALVGAPMTMFAYPYGYPGSFDDVTIDVLRAAGYTRAYTTAAGSVRASTDPFRGPRHPVIDVDGDEFGEHLARWLS